MDELILQEKFEIEVLNAMNSEKLLDNLVFAGGTMLRLCFGLNRYSVDLDFWVIKKINYKDLFNNLNQCLAKNYSITDSENKSNTILFEIKSPQYPRKLKIEIRKKAKKIKTEKAIAYSKNSTMQILLNIVSLYDMMKAKIAALIDRKEIRDAFDIEFLFRKGIKLNVQKNEAEKILDTIDSFSITDYKSKLGSLLDPVERKYYSDYNFKILKMELQQN